MKFLEQDNYLKLSKSKTEANYTQTIHSTIYLNSKIKKQSTEKIINVKTESLNTNSFEVKINSKLITINLDSKLKKQEQLSKQINEITNKVHLQLNTKCEFISIINHDEIVHKWNNLKKELLKKYKGESIERYFEGLNRRIKDQNSLLKNFNQLRGFGLLWMIPFGNYNTDQPYKQKRNIDNMISHLPLRFDEKIQLKEYKNDELTYKISGDLSVEQEYSNKIKNYFTRQHLSTQSNLKLDKYLAIAKYNIKTGLLNDLEFDITTSYGDKYKKEQQYNLTKHL